MRKVTRQICVYAVRNIFDGKINIGSTLNFDRRMREHVRHLTHGVHANSFLQAAWKKHGAHSFVWGIIEEVESEDGLKELEQSYILQHKSHDNKHGYNIAFPVKQRVPSQRMSGAHKSYWSNLTPEEKERRVAHLKGRSIQIAATAGKRTQKSRDRAREKANAQWANEEIAARTAAAIRQERAERLSDPERMAVIGAKIRKKAQARWKDPEYRKLGLDQLD